MCRLIQIHILPFCCESRPYRLCASVINHSQGVEPWKHSVNMSFVSNVFSPSLQRGRHSQEEQQLKWWPPARIPFLIGKYVSPLGLKWQRQWFNDRIREIYLFQVLLFVKWRIVFFFYSICHKPLTEEPFPEMLSLGFTCFMKPSKRKDVQ